MRINIWIEGRASAARQQPHSVVEAISEPLNSIKRGLLQTRSQAEFRPIFTDLSDARTRTPRAPLSVSSAKAAAASITCSQLSSTGSIFRLMPRSEPRLNQKGLKSLKLEFGQSLWRR